MENITISCLVSAETAARTGCVTFGKIPFRPNQEEWTALAQPLRELAVRYINLGLRLDGVVNWENIVSALKREQEELDQKRAVAVEEALGKTSSQWRDFSGKAMIPQPACVLALDDARIQERLASEKALARQESDARISAALQRPLEDWLAGTVRVIAPLKELDLNRCDPRVRDRFHEASELLKFRRSKVAAEREAASQAEAERLEQKRRTIKDWATQQGGELKLVADKGYDVVSLVLDSVADRVASLLGGPVARLTEGQRRYDLASWQERESPRVDAIKLELSLEEGVKTIAKPEPVTIDVSRVMRVELDDVDLDEVNRFTGVVVTVGCPSLSASDRVLIFCSED